MGASRNDGMAWPDAPQDCPQPERPMNGGLRGRSGRPGMIKAHQTFRPLADATERAVMLNFRTIAAGAAGALALTAASAAPVSADDRERQALIGAGVKVVARVPHRQRRRQLHRRRRSGRRGPGIRHRGRSFEPAAITGTGATTGMAATIATPTSGVDTTSATTVAMIVARTVGTGVMIAATIAGTGDRIDATTVAGRPTGRR